MNIKQFSLIIVLFCNYHLDAQKIDSLSFPKIKSSVSIPIRVPISELNATANASVENLIFQDDSYADNNNDQFKVKVWKNGQIRIIPGKSQNLIIEVPIKVWAEKGIGTLGVYTYQNTSFETTMYFNTQLTFTPNWTIKTQTSAAGYKWVTKPTLDFGKIKVPITSFVENSLKKQQSEFGPMIDQQLASKLNFYPSILSVINLFAQPTEISQEYNTWLKITPTAANIAPLTLYSNAIDANLGIDVFSETFTGFQPKSNVELKTLPPLNFVTKIPNTFLLKTTANIPYFKATEIAKQYFLNKEFDFREGKSKIKITDIKVYKDDQRTVVEIQTQGSVNGVSFISGIPIYDASKRKIVLTDSKFKIRTSNILHKTASLLFKGKIIKMIEQEYGIPTKDLEDTSKKSIEEAFNKLYSNGMKVTGRVQSLHPSKILVTDAGLTAIIDTKASLQVYINNLN